MLGTLHEATQSVSGPAGYRGSPSLQPGWPSAAGANIFQWLLLPPSLEGPVPGTTRKGCGNRPNGVKSPA